MFAAAPRFPQFHWGNTHLWLPDQDQSAVRQAHKFWHILFGGGGLTRQIALLKITIAGPLLGGPAGLAGVRTLGTITGTQTG